MQSSNRVKEIRSWYGTESPGILASLARIMNTGRLAGTGKFVIFPMDQGDRTWTGALVRLQSTGVLFSPGFTGIYARK